MEGTRHFLGQLQTTHFFWGIARLLNEPFLVVAFGGTILLWRHLRKVINKRLLMCCSVVSCLCTVAFDILLRSVCVLFKKKPNNLDLILSWFADTHFIAVCAPMLQP